MGERITINAFDGGSFEAYVARPQAALAPAVVVIQEIFGVNRFVRDVADRLAAEGFLAVAPDLFWRIEPGVDITDQSEAEWKKAFELYNAFDVDGGVKDIQATINAIRKDPACSRKVGAVGFCLGGLLAFLTAAETDSDASVSYYGVGIENRVDEAGNLQGPLLMHIAEEDQFVPKAAQDKIVSALRANPRVEIHTYPGRDHAFAREGGAHYHAADAAAANQRTVAFFRRNLR
jgi:carboxymethylenebutenolidase